MKIQKFNEYINEGVSKQPTIFDMSKLAIDIEIVDYLFRCGLIDENFVLYDDDHDDVDDNEHIDWSNVESLESWGLGQPSYGGTIDIPNDVDLRELVKKVKAVTKTYTNLLNYIKKMNE